MISPIPPLVYTPYVVAVMPTFKIASIFVIFSAVFWPTFQTMIARVSGMDPKIIQSAKVIAGIVLMGIVVTIIDLLVKKLESSLIKWK